MAQQRQEYLIRQTNLAQETIDSKLQASTLKRVREKAANVKAKESDAKDTKRAAAVQTLERTAKVTRANTAATKQATKLDAAKAALKHASKQVALATATQAFKAKANVALADAVAEQQETSAKAKTAADEQAKEVKAAKAAQQEASKKARHESKGGRRRR